MEIKRQFVYWVNLDPSIEKEIQKERPCLVISPSIFNNQSGLVTIVPLTDIYRGRVRKTEIPVYEEDDCVEKPSKVKPEQIRTISAVRFGREMGKFPDDKFAQVLAIIRDNLNL